jgi:hypothetical protein
MDSGRVEGDSVRVQPLDGARSRVYLPPLGLWLTLEAGSFQAVAIAGDRVRLTLSPATPHAPAARLRIERPSRRDEPDTALPTQPFPAERGAYVIPLTGGTTQVTLHARG